MLNRYLYQVFSFGNSGRESNPPFQPTIRLSPKIVSGDQPSTVSVIKPNTLSLFILRKVNSISESLARNSTGCSGKPRIIRFLSHSLLILYQILSEMSSFFFTSSFFYCAFSPLAHSPQISSYFSYFSFGREGERWCPVLRSALGLTIMWAHRHVSPLTPSLFCFI